MDASDVVKQELAKISATLSKALETSTPKEWRSIVEKTIHQIDDVIQGLEKPKESEKN